MLNSVLITGGCGFIGRSLVRHILKEHLQTGIRVLDNFSVGTPEDLAEVCEFRKIEGDSFSVPRTGEVQLIEGDIRHYNTCFRSATGMDTVVHLAANTGVAPSVQDPRLDMEANVIGTFNMLEAARQNKINKFIFASSGAPVGEIEPPIHEEKCPKPVSPYGASKLAGEGYCSAYFRTFGLPTVALRFGNVYGPLSGHKASVVAKFFKGALSGEPLEIYGNGTQTRDFIFIDDLVRAVIMSMSSAAGGEVFQIASSRETTVNEIALKIKDLVEGETARKVEVVHGDFRQGDVRRNYSDISKARKMLGYEPLFDLEAGLERTFQYFKSRISRPERCG